MMFKLARGSIACLIALAALAAQAGTPPGALVGYAVKKGNSVILTQQTTSSLSKCHECEGDNGAAWRTQPVSLTRSFQMRFSFSLESDTIPQADGIAFVIQTDGTKALGAWASGVGYFGLDGVASVIQTYTNNHLGLSLDGNPFSAKAAPADLGNARRVTGTEVVSYDAVNHVMSMQGQIEVDGSAYDVSDSMPANLASLLGSDTATIGFTGGTGWITSTQRVYNTVFKYTD